MRLIDATAAAKGLSWVDEQFGRTATVIFDFDGVLCTPVEDQVYKLSPCPGERELLGSGAREKGIDPGLYDTPYLRHLLLQVMLEEDGTVPEPGPLLTIAKQLTRKRRSFFILTARSGGSAIRRLLGFVEQHDLVPQEMFFVGRVPKGRQLSLVNDMVRGAGRVVYFEDTARHVRNSRQQDLARLETVHVALPTRPEDEPARLRDRLLAHLQCVTAARSAA